MKKLSAQGQEKLFAVLSSGFDIYNAFAPGSKGEKLLLKLRDDVQRRLKAGDPPETPMTVTLPLELVGYMMSASKHLGDQCMAISQMDNDGVLFR